MKACRYYRSVSGVFLFLLLVVAMVCVEAADSTWVSRDSGEWRKRKNWANRVVPSQAGDVARFNDTGGAGRYVGVELRRNVTLGELYIDSSNDFTISNAGGDLLFEAGSEPGLIHVDDSVGAGNHRIQTGVLLAGDLKIINDSAQTLSFGGGLIQGLETATLTVGGAGATDISVAIMEYISPEPISLVKNGRGRLSLSTPNEISGDVLIQGGAVRALHPLAFGTSRAVTISGATLELAFMGETSAGRKMAPDTVILNHGVIDRVASGKRATLFQFDDGASGAQQGPKEMWVSGFSALRDSGSHPRGGSLNVSGAINLAGILDRGMATLTVDAVNSNSHVILGSTSDITLGFATTLVTTGMGKVTLGGVDAQGRSGCVIRVDVYSKLYLGDDVETTLAPGTSVDLSRRGSAYSGSLSIVGQVRCLEQFLTSSFLDGMAGEGGLELEITDSTVLTISESPAGGKPIRLTVIGGPSGSSFHLGRVGGESGVSGLEGWGGLSVLGGNVTLLSDVRFAGAENSETDFYINGGTLHLNGKTLSVEGNIDWSGGIVSGGWLETGGDVQIYENETRYSPSLPNIRMKPQYRDVEISTFFGQPILSGPLAVTNLVVCGIRDVGLAYPLDLDSLVVESGRFVLKEDDSLESPSDVALKGGAIATQGHSEQFGRLSILGNAVLDLGMGGSVVTFLDSSSETWSGSLVIENWHGDGLGGGGDQVVFLDGDSSLRLDQVASVTFSDPFGGSVYLPTGDLNWPARLLPSGELVPLPEHGSDNPPVAVDDVVCLSMSNTSAEVDVFLNDVFPNGEGTLVSHTSPPLFGVFPGEHGVFTIESYLMVDNGQRETFTYTVADRTGATATGTVQIRFGNTPPLTADDVFVVDPGHAIMGSLAEDNGSGTDADPEGDDLTYFPDVVQAPTHGTVLIQPDGTFEYIPHPGLWETDMFQYRVTDGCDVSTGLVTVMQNLNPVATDDVVYAVSGSSVATRVLELDYGNGVDWIPRGIPLTGDVITLLSSPQNGRVGVVGRTTIVYAANQGFVGTDTFRYRLTDSSGAFDDASVTIHVRCCPIIQSGGFHRLGNHPHTQTATRSHGLQLADLYDVTGEDDIFTFDFEAPGTFVTLRYFEGYPQIWNPILSPSSDIEIEGIVYGGLEGDDRYDGYWKISYEFVQVQMTSDSDQDDIISRGERVSGELTRLDTGEEFPFDSLLVDSGLFFGYDSQVETFQLGDSDGAGYLGYSGTSGWGPIHFISANLDISDGSFLFTVDPNPLGAQNAPPLPVTDSLLEGVTAGTTIVLPFSALSGNFSDPEGDDLTVVSLTNPVNGMLEFRYSDQLLHFTTTETDGAFSYGISDGNQYRDTPATFEVGILDQPCGSCSGSVTDLTLTYIGNQAATVRFEGGGFGGERHVVPGNTIPLNQLIGEDISISVDGELDTVISPLCRTGFGPGAIFGNFQIIAAWSHWGGLVCPPPMEDLLMIPSLRNQ